MSEKIKIFYDSNPEELEGHANAWLEKHPEARVSHMNMQIGSTLELSGGGTPIWNGLSFLALVYTLSKS